jgi:hypothetical protein
MTQFSAIFPHFGRKMVFFFLKKQCYDDFFSNPVVFAKKKNLSNLKGSLLNGFLHLWGKIGVNCSVWLQSSLCLASFFKNSPEWCMLVLVK